MIHLSSRIKSRIFIMWLKCRTKMIASHQLWFVSKCIVWYSLMFIILHIFSFFCCPIMCLYIVWCPLRFPHKSDVRFVFTSSYVKDDSCVNYLQLYVEWLMSYLPPVICRMTHSYLPPVICRMIHVLFTSSYM